MPQHLDMKIVAEINIPTGTHITFIVPLPSIVAIFKRI
jgi:hypothetical protein